MFENIFDKLKKHLKELQKGSSSIEENSAFDIVITKENNIYKVEVSDYISLSCYVEKMKDVDADNISDLISSSIFWNSKRQCVNKGIYYIIESKNTTYSILVNDDELVIDEKAIKEHGTSKKTLRVNKNNNNYHYFRCDHDESGSSYDTRYYDKEGPSFGNLELSKTDAFRDIYHMLFDMEQTEGIDKIIDIDFLKRTTLGDLLNYLEDNVNYVCKKYKGFESCKFAKYSKEFNVFYDYIESDDCSETYNKQFTLGQKVIIGDCLEVYCYPNDIDKDIVEAINKKNEKYAEWEQKHPDLWKEPQEVPNTHALVRKYIENKILMGDFSNLYAIGVVELLYKLMGIKIRQRHGGSLYLQRGFDYEEEVYEAIDALYSIIDEKLSTLKKYEEIEFFLSSRAPNQAYNELTRELHKRTGYYFSSDYSDRLDSLYYHRNQEKYEKLFNQSPVVYLTKDRCVYVHDKNDKNSVKEEVTKGQCDVMYLNIKGSESAKVLKKV